MPACNYPTTSLPYPIVLQRVFGFLDVQARVDHVRYSIKSRYRHQVDMLFGIAGRKPKLHQGRLTWKVTWRGKTVVISCARRNERPWRFLIDIQDPEPQQQLELVAQLNAVGARAGKDYSLSLSEIALDFTPDPDEELILGLLRVFEMVWAPGIKQPHIRIVKRGSGYPTLYIGMRRDTKQNGVVVYAKRTGPRWVVRLEAHIKRNQARFGIHHDRPIDLAQIPWERLFGARKFDVQRAAVLAQLRSERGTAHESAEPCAARRTFSRGLQRRTILSGILDLVRRSGFDPREPVPMVVYQWKRYRESENFRHDDMKRVFRDLTNERGLLPDPPR